MEEHGLPGGIDTAVITTRDQFANGLHGIKEWSKLSYKELSAKAKKICDEEAGKPSADQWMTVQLPKTTVESFLNGRNLPLANTLVMFLRTCGVPSDQIPKWIEALERVRCAAATISVPAPVPPYVADSLQQVPPQARRRLTTPVLVLSGLLLVAVVVTVGILVGKPDTGTEPGEDVCSGSSHRLGILNHDSGLYISNDDRPRVGLLQSEIGVSPASTTRSGCVVSLQATSGVHRAHCLGVSEASGSEVTWQPCNDQASQMWLLESHWSQGELRWKRFHSLRDQSLDLCLQQASKDGPGTPIIVTTCGKGWLQQWRFVTD